MTGVQNIVVNENSSLQETMSSFLKCNQREQVGCPYENLDVKKRMCQLYNLLQPTYPLFPLFCHLQSGDFLITPRSSGCCKDETGKCIQRVQCGPRCTSARTDVVIIVVIIIITFKRGSWMDSFETDGKYDHAHECTRTQLGTQFWKFPEAHP